MTEIVTADCPVDDCPFMAVEDEPAENPEGAAHELRDHINAEHQMSELPDEDISDLL